MKILFIILISITAIIIAVYTFFHGFKKITFEISRQGGETLVYEEFIGDYSQSATVMDKIYYSLLNEEGIETFKGFGIYYDNPKKVETSRLRSEIGCILEDPGNKLLEKISGRYNIKIIPWKEYIITEFPYRGKMSVIMGIMKVYPALNKFIRDKGFDEDGWVMEIYDIPNTKIVYRKEIIRK